MKWMSVVIISGLVALASVVAHADDPSGQDVTEYRFNDDIVEGDLRRPDETIVPSWKHGKSKSLIKARGHFVHQMLKSVEDI